MEKNSFFQIAQDINAQGNFKSALLMLKDFNDCLTIKEHAGFLYIETITPPGKTPMRVKWEHEGEHLTPGILNAMFLEDMEVNHGMG